MESNRTLLKIAGISYCLFGCLLLDIPVIGILVIAAGVFLYIESQQPFNHIYESRALIYTIAILGLFNLFGSIILFITISDVISKTKANNSNAPPEKEKLDKEQRRIDILLKLGVGMVFLSAFLLSTTSWQFITNNIKVLSLAILGFIFLLLSIITEKKFKLYNSSFMYWFLSMSLFTFSVVGLFFFKLIGPFLTYWGTGKMLTYSITWFIASLLSVITFIKYSKKSTLYLCYAFLTTTLSCLLSYLQFSMAMNFSIIALILIFLNIVVHKKGTLYFFSKLASYILFILLVKYQSLSMTEHITSTIIALINLNYFTLLFPDDEEPLLPVLCSYILILVNVQGVVFLGDYYNLILSLILGVYTLLISSNIIKSKEITKKICYFVFTFAIIIISIIAINDGPYLNYLMSPVIIVLVFGLINTMLKYGLFNVTKWKCAYHFETIALLLLVASVLKSLSPQFDITYILGTTAVIASIIHFISKDEYQKKIYNLFLITILIIAILLCSKFMHIFATILIIPSSLYLFINTYLNYKDEILEKVKLAISYVILLSSFTFPYIVYNILDLDILLPICLVLFLSFFIAYVLNNKTISRVTYLYIIVPICVLLKNYNYADIEAIIISNAIILYLSTLIVNMFVKNKIAKNILIICFTTIFLIPLFAYPNILTALYVGIVGLIMILLNMNSSNNTPIFITGIIITIINIIYSLKDIWLQIPFWLYLLVGGLVIIVSVLIKELKRKD